MAIIDAILEQQNDDLENLPKNNKVYPVFENCKELHELLRYLKVCFRAPYVKSTCVGQYRTDCCNLTAD